MKYIQNVGWIYPPWVENMVDKSTLRVISIILLFAFIQAHAGLTDFKTIDQATEAYNSKEYTKSVTLLERLKKSNATNELHYNLGNTYYKKGYYEKAIEEYQISEGVDEASRQYNLGNSYFKNSELDKSIESFKKSLKLKDDPETRHNLEIAEKQKKEKEKKQQKKDKQEDKKNNDNKKNNKENQEQKNNDKDKKEGKQNKEDENKKGKDDNKEGDEKESDSKKKKKSLDKKDDKSSTKVKEQNKISKEDKLKEQELKRLMKKMQKGKTPTMMYQMGESKKGQRSDDAKPW